MTAVGILQQQRVHPVLGGHHLGHLAVGGHDADAADAPLGGLALFQQSVDVHRLVCAVKATYAEMHYADADFIAVVAGLGNRDLRQRRIAELHDTVTTVFTLPGVRSESRASATFSSGKRAVTMASRSTRPDSTSAIAVGQVLA